MIDVKKIRLDFPMLRGLSMQEHPLVYLDNAATTFKPYSVIEAMTDYYSNYTANAHRGDYDLSHTVDVKYEEARAKVAHFLNAETNEVVFTSGASMSINLVAYGMMKSLHPGDEVLITQAEHASNVLPWFKIAEMTGCSIGYIPLTDEGRLTGVNLRSVISKKTKIVAVAQVTNVLGYVIDIKELAKITHEFGAQIVVDAAQSAPHMKIDVKDLDCDFLSFSGHKMCGPTGIGVLFGKFSALDKMDPLLSGGGMNTRFDTCGDVYLQVPPLKFEAGTQNIAGAIGLGAAVDYLTKIGLDNIEAYEKELHKRAIEGLKKIPEVILYNEHADGGIITFNIKDVFAQDVASLFNSKGICVRSGQHCAKILMDFLGTYATVRCSFYFYNTFEDVDAFVEACSHGKDFLDAYFK